MRSRRGFVAALFALLAACRTPPPPSPPPTPATSAPMRAAAPAPDASAISAVDAPPAPPVVTVLYRGRVPADIARGSETSPVTTILVGVERTQKAAWLRHMVSSGKREVDELVRVPLETTAFDPPPTARFSKGTSEKAVASYAAMLDALGPLPRNDEFLATSREHIVHEDGDHLVLRGKDGKAPRRFGQFPGSAYKPALSPDGQTAAFWGCDPAIASRGRTLPEVQACYALYVGPTQGKGVRISEVAEATAPVFDAEGRYVYATSVARSKSDASKRDGGCLYRVAVAPPYARERLVCASSEDDRLALHLAPDGKTAVLGATRRTPDLAMIFTWVALPEGRPLGTTTIPLASDYDGVLGPSGLFVVTAGGGVVVADATGTYRAVPGLEKAFASPVPQWDGDAVYALNRQPDGTLEILRIDARAAFARR